MLVPTTRSAYETGFQCFKRFLLLNNVRCDFLTLPTMSEELMLLFVTHCHSVLKLSFSTIKLYVSAVKFAYVQAGNGNPFVYSEGNPYARLLLICRAIRKVQAPRAPTSLPITGDLLCKIMSILSLGMFTPFTDVMLSSACSLAFYGFLRCSDFTVRQQSFNPSVNLCIGDVSILPNKITVNLKSFKTDIFHKRCCHKHLQ